MILVEILKIHSKVRRPHWASYYYVEEQREELNIVDNRDGRKGDFTNYVIDQLANDWEAA